MTISKCLLHLVARNGIVFLMFLNHGAAVTTTDGQVAHVVLLLLAFLALYVDLVVNGWIRLEARDE